MSKNMEKIVEFREDMGEVVVVQHVLSFDEDSGTFVLESLDCGIFPESVVVTLDSQEACQWATEVAGLDPDEAARRVIGLDSL